MNTRYSALLLLALCHFGSSADECFSQEIFITDGAEWPEALPLYQFDISSCERTLIADLLDLQVGTELAYTPSGKLYARTEAELVEISLLTGEIVNTYSFGQELATTTMVALSDSIFLINVVYGGPETNALYKLDITSLTMEFIDDLPYTPSGDICVVGNKIFYSVAEGDWDLVQVLMDDDFDEIQNVDLIDIGSFPGVFGYFGLIGVDTETPDSARLNLFSDNGLIVEWEITSQTATLLCDNTSVSFQDAASNGKSAGTTSAAYPANETSPEIGVSFISPNQLLISHFSHLNLLSLDLVDVSGRLCKSEKLTNHDGSSLIWNVPFLSPGIYFLSLLTSDHRVSVRFQIE